MKTRAISCHNLFPTVECKQTWLLNFVSTIDFTSSQFAAYEKRYSVYRKEGKCYLFQFLYVIIQLFDPLICNLTKLVNILCNYAASEQKRFLKGLKK